MVIQVRIGCTLSVRILEVKLIDLNRPEVGITLPRDALSTLSPRARLMLRYNTVVDFLDAPNPNNKGTTHHEKYQSFAH